MTPRCFTRLSTVHPDLQEVILSADQHADPGFIVTEGIRTLARQKELFAAGKSRTLNSRHLSGHAVDLAVWFDRDADKVVDADELSWKLPYYAELNEVIQYEARKLNIPIVWGGNWTSFVDGPHWELDRRYYP